MLCPFGDPLWPKAFSRCSPSPPVFHRGVRIFRVQFAHGCGFWVVVFDQGNVNEQWPICLMMHSLTLPQQHALQNTSAAGFTLTETQSICLMLARSYLRRHTTAWLQPHWNLRACSLMRNGMSVSSTLSKVVTIIQ